MSGTIERVTELERSAQLFEVRKKHLLPGKTFPAHWHRYFELEVLLSGSCEQTINGEHVVNSAGDAWLLTCYDFHSFTDLTEAELITVGFEKEFLPPELSDAVAGLRSGLRLPADHAAGLREQAERLKEAAGRGDAFRDTECRAILSEILLPFFRSAEPAQRTYPSLIREAVGYTDRHFREELSLSQTARSLGVSVNYLGTLFRETLGVSYRDYLAKLRLRYACELLASSDLPIKEIALVSGYSSVEYFFCSFRKNLGITPAAYRKNGGNP